MMIFAVDRTKWTEMKKARIVVAAAAVDAAADARRFVRRADCSAAVEM